MRITSKVKVTDSSKLLERRAELVQKLKLDPDNEDLKSQVDSIVDDLTKLVAEENNEKIMENFKCFDQSEGGNVTLGVWETLKKTFPKNPPTLPAAKIDQNGRLVSD